MDRKIKSQEEIAKIAARLKSKGKRIVTFNGSFDILHVGHIRSLQEAKSKGDILTILLNSDKSIKSYKGPNRPIIPEEERAETLDALECVDYVTIFDEINPLSILNKIKPYIHCNGSDWGRNCIEREVVEKGGGKIHILKWQKGHSTTTLIDRIVEIRSNPTVKAIFLDRDGTISDNKQDYIHKIEDFQFLPGAIEALQVLSKTDYKIIIITNQSGIARGFYTEDAFKTLSRWFLETLQEKGVLIDRIYHCPHAPDEDCPCRKPEIGMLMQAVKDFGISLNSSWLIGDDPKDVIMGRMANVKTIKLGTKMPSSLKLQPNYYAKNLLEAANIVLSI